MTHDVLIDHAFVYAAHNSLAALIFAVLVFGITRVLRNPPVVHLLWVLVLLKLVAPPIVRVDWSELWTPDSAHVRTESIIDEQQAAVQQSVVDQPTALAPASIEQHEMVAPPGNYRAEVLWTRGRPILFWLWIGGTASFALATAVRVVRFERLLRGTLPASQRVQQLVSEIAGQLRLQKVPDVRYVESINVPFLWWAGRRAKIVLPTRLLHQLGEQRLILILAHELAHVRRRDHWVRAIELGVSIVYWWNPLVWVIRRQIHQSEEICCDAWVRWIFPERTRCYAEVLLTTAESLSAKQTNTRLLPASPLLRSLKLKARIEMLLNSRFAPHVSARSMCAMALLSLLFLPSVMQTIPTEARGGTNDKAPATTNPEPQAATTSEFPYRVKFEQGATSFSGGDNITIVEVRGTAETFVPGNIYWIKGTYTLASHDRAAVSAYTTAANSVDGTSTPYKVQSIVVDKGNGTFTLFLPMSCKGWPHVSFYPADHGEGFGGNYFGTGDSVLKKWWEKESEK